MNPQALTGSIFAEDFRIVAALGRTDYAAFYVAERLSRNAPCILELLFAAVVPGRAFRERFAEQAMEPSGDSAHLAPAIAAGIEGDTPWLAFECFAPDGMLTARPPEDIASAVARRGAFADEDAARIVDEVAQALGLAHASGFAHGALRPESVHLLRSPSSFTTRLINFGVANILANAKRAAAPSAPSSDPRWSAPETFRGRSTPLSDVWSLGLLSFFLLTGHPFWRAEGNGALLQEVAIDPLALPSVRAYELGCGDRIPRGFDAFFARCLAREPTERFANAAAAAAAFALLFQVDPRDVVTGSSIAPMMFLPPVPAKKSRAPQRILGAVLTLSLLAGGGALGWRGVNAYATHKAIAASAPPLTASPVETAVPAPVERSAIPLVALEDLPRASPRASGRAAPNERSARVATSDVVVGKGVAAKSGDTVKVLYVARVDGSAEYDAKHRTEPLSFTLGKGTVTRGGDQGILGMKVGGKRKVVVPSAMGYGERGLAPQVPGNATLVLEIELVAIE